MKCSYLLVLFTCITSVLLAQQPADSTVVDPKYREDQFYVSITYNLLGSKPDGLKQSGFSSGFHFGMIRDMPINERRNKAIGVGLGLSTNSYNQNLLIMQGENRGNDFEIINENVQSLKKNKFTTYLVEMPLQYRWRTSTAKDYKFWRIYTGLKFGYVYYSSSKFVGGLDDVKLTNIEDIEKFQYGLTLSAGYSTWNFNIYYGLNPIFKDSAQLDGNTIDMTSIKIGLMFYIL